MMRFVLALLLWMLPTTSADAMTLDVRGLDGMEWILATGEISIGDAVALEMMLDERPDLRWLVLDSSGGDLWAGERLGRSVRKLGLGTVVPSGGKCLSACFLVFIGGTNRMVADHARLGMHQFYGTRDDETADEAQAYAQWAAARLYRYVSEMGIDPEALTKALAVPPSMMLLYRADEMEDYRLTTIPDLPDSDRKIIVDRCTGNVVTGRDDIQECSPLERWVHITVPDFLAVHPEYRKGTALYERLDGEVRRLQSESTDPLSPEILKRAHEHLSRSH